MIEEWFHHVKHHLKEKKMADITVAVAAFQTARDGLNQASDDLVTAANDAVAAGDPGDAAIRAAVEQAAQTLAPFSTPPAPPA